MSGAVWFFCKHSFVFTRKCAFVIMCAWACTRVCECVCICVRVIHVWVCLRVRVQQCVHVLIYICLLAEYYRNIICFLWLWFLQRCSSYLMWWFLLLTWLFILVAHVRLYVIYWYYYYDWKYFFLWSLQGKLFLLWFITGRQYYGSSFTGCGHGLWWGRHLLLDPDSYFLQDVQAPTVSNLVSSHPSCPVCYTCHFLFDKYPFHMPALSCTVYSGPCGCFLFVCLFVLLTLWTLQLHVDFCWQCSSAPTSTSVNKRCRGGNNFKSLLYLEHDR